MHNAQENNSLPGQSLPRAAARFESWFREHALPLWARAGFDPAAHAFYERLLPGGSPDLKSDLRLRVQARQIFVFAFAHELGWYDGRALAERAFGFVERVAAHPAGGYAHLLDCRHTVIDRRRDLYDHAFLLLACAWCYRAFGSENALEKASRLTDYLDRTLGSDKGGWLEGDYAAACRRQNPHMHMLEAFLALYDASDERRWLDRAGLIIGLFENRFYDARRGVLLEYFTDDWTPVPGGQGEIVEPGHMMEWAWLLRWYESRARRSPTSVADILYDKARALGTSAASGLLIDEIGVDGRVLGASKRCWPQTEYIKAAVAQARAGRRECEAHAAQAIDRLFRYYLDEVAIPGLYMDRRDANDAIIPGPVPASTLYHLIVAAAEASAYCKERNQDQH
jgi:mannose/cellobiose epimerase-like protein (N-acyl-D-glucosamine 2-epimerase family)